MSGETSPLSLAFRLTLRASKLGFDWPDVTGILEKLEEEAEEFKEAFLQDDRGKMRDELGDLLFVLVNLCRFLRIDPDKALSRTNRKFISRFRYVEEGLRRKGKAFSESTLAEMDALWEEAKRKQKKRKGQEGRGLKHPTRRKPSRSDGNV